VQIPQKELAFFLPQQVFIPARCSSTAGIVGNRIEKQGGYL